MVSYNVLNQKFPKIKEIEPDHQIILFAYECMKVDVYAQIPELLIGMLKYVLDGRIQDYKAEYRKLYNWYITIFG